jgi:hypothetical protein
MGNSGSSDFFQNFKGEQLSQLGNIFSNVGDALLKVASVVLTPFTAALSVIEGNPAGALSALTGLPDKLMRSFDAIGGLVTSPTQDRNINPVDEIAIIAGVAGVPEFITKGIANNIMDTIKGHKIVAEKIDTTISNYMPYQAKATDILAISDPNFKAMRMIANMNYNSQQAYGLVKASIDVTSKNYSIVQGTM